MKWQPPLAQRTHEGGRHRSAFPPAQTCASSNHNRAGKASSRVTAEEGAEHQDLLLVEQVALASC